jgi:MarR family 2-MHQ and catechol resistance regulon transcriptional repressor
MTCSFIRSITEGEASSGRVTLYQGCGVAHNRGVSNHQRYQFFVDGSGRLHESSVHDGLRMLFEVYPTLDLVSMEAEIMLERCHRLMALERDALWEPLGLTGSRFILLRLLYAAESQRLTMGQIAAQMNLEPNNVTQLVAWLVAQGLVQKEAASTDKRVTYAVLTPEGMKLFLTAMEAGARRTQQALDVLDDRERQNLSHLLTKVRMHLLANASRLDEDHSSDKNRITREKRSRQ